MKTLLLVLMTTIVICLAPTVVHLGQPIDIGNTLKVEKQAYGTLHLTWQPIQCQEDDCEDDGINDDDDCVATYTILISTSPTADPLYQYDVTAPEFWYPGALYNWPDYYFKVTTIYRDE